MSKNLRNCLSSMSILTETKCKKLKRSILCDFSKNDKYFKAIFEIVLNLSENKMILTSHEKKKLNKHLKILEKILKNPKCKRKRSLAVKQSGGFLNILLPIVGTLITELISNAFSKKGNTNP